LESPGTCVNRKAGLIIGICRMYFDADSVKNVWFV
jgi:hypothetical protein